MAKYEHASVIFVETGLQAGLLVSARIKTPSGVSNIKNTYRSFDLSWPIGAGLHFKKGLGINLRYNLGLINLYKRGITELQPTNKVILEEIIFHFSPGNTFNGHSMANGWSKEYSILAELVGKIYNLWKTNNWVFN